MEKPPEKTPDRRTRRTRRLLLESLIALILEKGYEAVTVQDILNHADIGRSTFYAHFENKEQLLFSGHEGLITSVFSPLHRAAADSPTLPDLDFMALYQHIADNYHLAKGMIGKSGGNLIIGHLRDLMVLHFRQEFSVGTGKDKNASQRAAMLAEGVAAGLLGLVVWWLEAGMPFSVTQMANWSREVKTRFAELP